MRTRALEKMLGDLVQARRDKNVLFMVWLQDRLPEIERLLKYPIAEPKPHRRCGQFFVEANYNPLRPPKTCQLDADHAGWHSEERPMPFEQDTMTHEEAPRTPGPDAGSKEA